jgi:hypothetical protein
MNRLVASSLCCLAFTVVPKAAFAVASAEFYKSAALGYGRVEARIRFAAGDGVVSSFFLWKNGSETPGTFWNELDFEKLGESCHVETNAIYGNPSSNHSQTATLTADPCAGYHTYTYEWTPTAIVWSVDGVEIRRETGATATAFSDNASASGMQVRFNIWPGDASFGGNFSPSILPVHQYVDWVQFSSYQNGAFTLQWREDFNGNAVPSGWGTANWGSPKNLSTHNPSNVNFRDGYLILSLTADNALGPAGAMPGVEGGTGGSAGSSSGGSGGSSSGGSAGSSSGGSGASSSGGESGSAGTSQGGAAGSQGGQNSGGAGPTGGSGAQSSGGSSTTTGGSSATGGNSGASGGTDRGGGSGAESSGSATTNGDDTAGSNDSGGCSLMSSRQERPSALAVALGIVAIGALRRRWRDHVS